MSRLIKTGIQLIKSYWQKLFRKDDDVFNNPHVIF